MNWTFDLDADMEKDAITIAAEAGVDNVASLAKKLLMREIVQRRIDKDTIEFRTKRAAELAKEHGFEVR